MYLYYNTMKLDSFIIERANVRNRLRYRLSFFFVLEIPFIKEKNILKYSNHIFLYFKCKNIVFIYTAGYDSTIVFNFVSIACCPTSINSWVFYSTSFVGYIVPGRIRFQVHFLIFLYKYTKLI